MKKSALSSTLVMAVIPVSLLVSILIYMFILGSPSNFIENNPENNPLPGNYLGIIYKGGILVPVLISLLLITVIFCIERYITVRRSRGTKPVDNFLHEIRSLIAGKKIDEALKLCQAQKGSVANVIYSGLITYQLMEKDTTTDKDHKILTIQKSIEECTSLELPMLSKNLPIISTIASIATLMGLLGTVLGMVKAFAAMATAGAPDAVALANGISEALINTALGIGTSAIAIVFYNYFTTRIDNITYGIDEAGYSIVQSYSASH
ncbi:MAG: MotA/TolQ/ExbB proton channel family protein [Bacteroidetes bacterium]|nr:MotA/TolQ/ExbB proton channel family protein [Bacteroidota bacterium]